MLQKKHFIALVIATSALVGCGGDDGDNITINVDQSGPTSTPTPTPGPGVGCGSVVEATFVDYNDDCSTGSLSGTIDSDFTLTNEVEWLLDGLVVVGGGNVNVASDADVQAIKDAGVTLTIEPGTHVRGFANGSLLVTRGSMLMADGTLNNPITFSSSRDADFDGLGEWGGVVIQGFAPQYGQGNTGACFGAGTTCNVAGEGGGALFGGNETDDNSGVIRYVRIAEGGFVVGPDDEINGLTLQGVGHGTTIEYVQVHNNLDDGVEWFGGTVDARYLVLTGNDDDDIDYDEGYQGNIQYAIIQKDQNKSAPSGSNDPRGIEANSSDADYTPQTAAVLANVTIVGSDVSNAGGQPGMRLRGAVTTEIYNSSVQNFDTGCIRIDDADTDGDSVVDVNSNVTLVNVLNDCQDGIYDRRDADSATNVTEEVLSYTDTYAIKEAEAQLATAPAIVAVNNGSGFVFDQTDYIGAVDPDALVGWWEGWTLPDTVLEGPTPEAASFVDCDMMAQECTVTGDIDQDYTFVRGFEWILDGGVVVGDGDQIVSDQAGVDAIRAGGVTLTIEPGVNVRGTSSAFLLVTRGSRLMAEGTAASPITFSSNQDDNLTGEGEWGGVIVQGFAPQYGQGNTGACFGAGVTCNVAGEGGGSLFGGNDPADDSGVIRYVRIAEGGFVVGPDDEINGLTLQGVGHGTTVEYVQVHENLDDGVEWFGGTVNARYLVLTNNDDDDIDYDEGYQGNIQYAIVRKNPTKTAPTGSNDPRGIEANSSDADYVPQTNATLANILVLGSPVNNSAGGEQPGMRLRGALTTSIYNTAVRDFNTGCIRIDDADINGDDVIDVTSNVTLVNVLGECQDGFYDRRNADSETNAVANPVTVDAAYALTDAQASVTAPTITAVDNGSGFTFDNTDFVGAVAPGTDAADAWWAGWIIEGSLD